MYIVARRSQRSGRRLVEAASVGVGGMLQDQQRPAPTARREPSVAPGGRAQRDPASEVEPQGCPAIAQRRRHRPAIHQPSRTWEASKAMGWGGRTDEREDRLAHRGDRMAALGVRRAPRRGRLGDRAHPPQEAPSHRLGWRPDAPEADRARHLRGSPLDRPVGRRLHHLGVLGAPHRHRRRRGMERPERRGGDPPVPGGQRRSIRHHPPTPRRQGRGVEVDPRDPHGDADDRRDPGDRHRRQRGGRAAAIGIRPRRPLRRSDKSRPVRDAYVHPAGSLVPQARARRSHVPARRSGVRPPER